MRFTPGRVERWVCGFHGGGRMAICKAVLRQDYQKPSPTYDLCGSSPPPGLHGIKQLQKDGVTYLRSHSRSGTDYRTLINQSQWRFLLNPHAPAIPRFSKGSTSTIEVNWVLSGKTLEPNKSGLESRPSRPVSLTLENSFHVPKPVSLSVKRELWFQSFWYI